MATLSTQTIKRAGLKPSYASASGGGDKFHPGGRTFLHVKNGSGGSITVTAVTPKQVDGEEIADRAVAIPAGEEKMIGPLPASLFANPSDSGLGAITYSGVTSLTIAAVSLDAA